MARGPSADTTLIYNHQGWKLHTLPLCAAHSPALSLSHTHTALYLATLEWHHTGFVVCRINRSLISDSLAAVHKGDCLSLLINHHTHTVSFTFLLHFQIFYLGHFGVLKWPKLIFFPKTPLLLYSTVTMNFEWPSKGTQQAVTPSAIHNPTTHSPRRPIHQHHNQQSLKKRAPSGVFPWPI